jgi:hypothetical protein
MSLYGGCEAISVCPRLISLPKPAMTYMVTQSSSHLVVEPYEESPHGCCTRNELEAQVGVEPTIKVLQTNALPLGYRAVWQAAGESNPARRFWRPAMHP